MAELTAPSHHHDDFASSSTASCSTSTSYVHYDILINHCGVDPDACTFATKLYSQLISRHLKVFLHKLEYMFEEEVTSQMEAAFSLASVQIAIFSPNYPQWKWCLDALVRMTKPGVTILPVFYKVEPFQVRWTGKDNQGPYAQWLHDHEEKERYDSQTIQNWRDVLSHVSEISGLKLEACNGDEEELLREVVKSVFKDFPCLCYHVFLNHRGPDSKTTLASQLYDRLTSRGLRVFLDKPELVEGVKIDGQIEVAIQFASVHIAIFSPNYAQSSWCLVELYLMTKSGAIILPVFYKVKPSVLDGEYAKDVVDHENSRRYKSDNIKRWRSALSEVAKIKCFFEMDGNDEDVLDEIVQRVLKNVPDVSQLMHSSEVQSVVKGVLKENVPRSSIVVVESDPESYFGLAERLIDFENAMLSQQKGRVEVKVVGVVGAAGIGKTALANLFFTRKRKDYKEYAFLSYVKGKGFTISCDHSHSDLIEPLKHSPNQSIMLLKHLLSFCHALIILDDADQLDDFLLIKSVLDPKSLILLTSSDKDLLTRSGIVDSSIYHLDGLTRAHSQKLFCFYAFSQPHPQPGFTDLVDEFLTACDGLPLSLKMFGELLCGENRSLWVKRLNGLDNSKLPHQIRHRLKISYDSLNQEEQQIFLDIAGFFIGEDRDTTTRICDLVSFTSLEKKCLVEVDPENKINMNDYLRDLVTNVAKGNPQRFWCETTKNINVLLKQPPSVLSQLRGIKMIPDLSLRGFLDDADLSEKSEGTDAVHDTDSCKDLLSSEMLRYIRRERGHNNRSCGPRNLKFVVAENFHVEDILTTVGSEDLIWLRWYKCPYPFLPSWIPMENLRVLEVAGHTLTELWQPKSQAPLQLRELNIFGPLSGFPNSIGQLKHLEKIVVNYFFDEPPIIITFPEAFFRLHSLKYLKLRQCSELLSLPDSFGKLTNLQHIDLHRACRLQMLPNSFGNLTLLKYLCLRSCSNLTISRETLGNITTLEYLDLSYCKKVKELPPQIAHQRSLKTLYLGGMKFRELPSGIEDLCNLECLELGSELMEVLPPSVVYLKSLKTLKITGCPKLIYSDVMKMDNLQILELTECGELHELPFKMVEGEREPLLLTQFRVGRTFCEGECLFRLKELFLLGTSISEVSFPEGVCPNLQRLDISWCQDLLEVGALPTTLISLNLSCCMEWRRFEKLTLQHKRLRKIIAEYCYELQELPGVEYVMSLEVLRVVGCRRVQWGGGVLEQMSQRLKEGLDVLCKLQM